MREISRLVAVVLSLLAVASCSDDSAAPNDQHVYDRIVGVWEVTSVTWGDSATQSPEGYTYWHFSSTGEYYIETITGHGYAMWACGQVSQDFVAVVVAPSDVVRKLHLEPSGDGESLVLRTISATGPAPKQEGLVRSDDREAFDWECD